MEEKIQERAVLVGLNADCFTQEQTATEESLEELEALLETAGGFCTGKMLQNRHVPDSHCFIGEGKALEVKMLVEATASTMVIFDNELSPGNIRALEEIIGVTVLDRSALIMDIFAQRAKTKEGRLQVELAQYKYLLPRLSGMGASLSRQGGGIGTRGPGETKLESDRRHIRERITRLEEELEQVRKVRAVQRERRMKNSIPVVAIVGYTNAGKSTLMNRLTGVQKSIVTDIEGTTRDIVEDTVQLGDIMLKLADCAGIRETDDTVENIGVQRMIERIGTAQLILAVFDGSRELSDDDKRLIALLHGKTVIPIINKSDLEARADTAFIENELGKAVIISAKTGGGASKLEQAIKQRCGISNLDAGAGFLANERQRQCALSAQAAVDRAYNALHGGMTADVAGLELEAALTSLYELSGKTASEEVIDRIFSRFCVGK